jgi:hypothetical protein
MQLTLIKILLVAALVAFSGWKGYDLGYKAASAKYEKAARETAQKAARDIFELNNKYRTEESLIRVRVQAIQDALKENQDAIKFNQGKIADLHRRAIELQFAAYAEPTPSEVSNATITVRECNGETVPEFSRALFEAIYADFGECDEIVEQLTAAQLIIQEYVKGAMQ